ncbi:MAG: (d)CMP kinase [Bacilli bacterium]|nr:(d)CMP kinase [Bacilli bacterium]
MYWQIAIDGPAGAGKSTIAKEVAKALHCEYIDTGAMYRAVTLKALRLDINMENESEYSFLDNTTIDFQQGKLFLDNQDVSEDIRSLIVSNNVSLVSKFKNVREKMVTLQQKLVQSKNIIMDGRDIGTVVLPNANLKIFLTANVEERARRRLMERCTAGKECFTLEETIREIQERDYKDSHREISPLAKATDAIEIDTSNDSVSEVVEKIISLVMERGYKMENIKTEKEMNVETSTAEEAKVEETPVVETPAIEEEAAPEAVEPAVDAAVEEALVTVEPTVAAVVEDAPEAVEPTVDAVVEEAPTQEVVEEGKETVPPVKELQLVEGTIVKIEKAQKEIKRGDKVVRPAKQERVLVRLENGQEGYLMRKDMVGVADDEDLADVFMEEEKLQVVVKKVFTDGGKVLLSTVLVQKREDIKKYEEVIANHGVFTAKVVKGIKVGLILEHEGYPCLLPTSQINVKPEEYDTLIGTELLVAPIRVDYNRIRLLVSNTVANAIQYRSEKQGFISTIKVGDTFDGVVKNIESYGAFVEIGKGVEGLLHISEIEHNRIIKVEKVLNVGDAVKVQVIKLDGDHIGLSRKSLLPNYWKEFIDANQVGATLSATVIEINKAGVVLQLHENVQGFLPRSEFSWERDVFIEDVTKVGDTLDAKIIELDLSKKRIILSRKQLGDNPWNTVRLKSGDTVSATIEKTVAEGVKVKVNGASGFLPKGNITPGTTFQEGQVVELIVRVYDPERTRLLLTMRDDNYSEHADKKQIQRYMQSQEKVSNTLGDYIDFEQFRTNRKKGK